MDITRLKRGERGVILLVSCEPALKERLRSLNIRAGGVVRLLKVSLFKRTFVVQAGGSRIAIRKEVAECVKLRKV